MGFRSTKRALAAERGSVAVTCPVLTLALMVSLSTMVLASAGSTRDGAMLLI